MDTLFFHPKIVHLPIALGVLMPLITTGVLIAWWRTWLPPRAWVVAVALQAILLGSGVMALRSGEAEEDRVERVVAESAIEAHEESAQAFVVASGVVLAIMCVPLVLPVAAAKATAAAAVLGTLVVLGLGYRTGQAGGELVYRHGAAQVYARDSGGTPAVISAREDDDD